MKKSVQILLIVFICGIFNLHADAQLGSLMNKVKSKIVDKALGNKTGSSDGSEGSEPSCAGQNDKIIFEFDKGFKIKMNEVTICIQDGDILLYSKLTDKYFVRKKNSDAPDGPFEANDPEVTRFVCDATTSSDEKKDFCLAYPEFISRSGDKYLIKFNGKTYGPYAVIQNFIVSSLKTKFLAQVIPDVMFTEKEGAQLQKEAEKSMTQAQQMEMARKMQEKMLQKVSSGGAMDFQMKVVSNVPVTDEGSLTAMYSSAIKYDEIVSVEMGKIKDLSGKTIFTFNQMDFDASGGFWLSSDNSRTATYSYGLLKFSDKKECDEVFSPYLIKEDGEIFLRCLYFSPKHNAIMALSIPF